MKDPNNREDMVLEVGLDYSSVQRGLEAVRRKGAKFWSGITKTTTNYGRALKDLSKTKMTAMSTSLRKSSKDYDVFHKGFRQFEREVRDFHINLNQLQATFSKATGAEKEELKSQIELMKEAQKLHYEGGKKSGQVSKLDSSAKEIGESTKGMIVAGFAAGVALMQKDFDGAFRDGAKTLGKGWQAAFAASGKGSNWLGKGLHKLGDDASRKAGEKGKLAGAGLEGLAAVSKSMGTVFKTIGPMLNMISKVGPMFEMAASSIMALVKLLIDAEAQAKDLNKQILQLSGTSGMWYKNMRRSGAALVDMGDTLGKIRDDATSLSNISWGINKDDHMAVLSTLAAEGVRIEELQGQFDKFGESAKFSSVQAKSFGGTVQVAVAYSRQFGVSLQEISQFQAEMMTEMGANLAEVQTGFHSMTQAANDSGIAANKFFGIIRGLSSDMSLYNTRMEDAVKILGKLGKVMSPKSAQKFMSNLMQGFKGKGRTDLVKMNLLNDGKGQGVVQKDIDRKAESLAAKIGGGVTAKDVMGGPGGKSTEELLKGVAKESQGSIREALIELRTDASMNKKGMFGSSMAMGNLSPGAAAQMTENALTRFGSKNKDGSRKKLGEVAGELGPEMMAENLGISREQLMAQVKFATALDEQRDELKKGMQNEATRAATLEKLRKAGIDSNKIDSAGYDDLLATMDEDAQKQLKDSSEEIDYAKRTSEHTSNVLDKIGALSEFLMNQLYKVMVGIWEAVLDLAEKAGAGDAGERRRAKLEAMAIKTGDKSLVDMASKSTSNDDFKKNLLQSDSFKAFLAPSKNHGQDDLRDKIAQVTKARDAASPSERKDLEDELASLTKALNAADEGKLSVRAKIDQQLGGTSEGEVRGEVRADAMREAIKEALGENIGGENLGKMKEGAGIGSVLGSYSEADQAKIMEKLVAKLSAGQLLAMMPKGGAPIASAGSAPPPLAANVQGPTRSTDVPLTAKQADVHNDAITEALDQVHHDARVKGIKLDKTFTTNTFWVEGKKAVLEATREALFEYFMYSDMDPAEIAKGLQAGDFNASNFATKNLAYQTKEGKSPKELSDLRGFANGGTIPSPKSPDSVFVAARPGETILPRGAQQGGSSSITVPITVNGPGGQELANMLEAVAINTIQDWERRRKYH